MFTQMKKFPYFFMLCGAMLCTTAVQAQRIGQTGVTANSRERQTHGRPVPGMTDVVSTPHAGKTEYRIVDSPAVRAPEGWVNVTFIETEVFNEGYQMLLDTNADTYGTVFPAFGDGRHFTASCDGIPADLYDAFEYKIPENADPSCTSPNVLRGNTVTIQIPEGTYDYVIAIPSPDRRIWVADGDNGRQDNMLFEYGKSYTFITGYSGVLYTDYIDIVIDHDLAGTPAAVSELTAVASDANDLEALISWTNPILTAGGDELLELTSVKVYQNDDPDPVYTSSAPVAGATESFTVVVNTSGAYRFKVVASNAEGAGPDAFTQTLRLCQRSILAYIENFEENGVMPECIESRSLLGEQRWQVYNDDTGYTRGARSVYFTCALDNEKNALILPRIEIPVQAAAPVLQFWTRTRYGEMEEGTSSVYITSEPGSDFESFTKIYTISKEERLDKWLRITLPLNEYAGETVQLAFLYEGNFAHEWFIDDIRVVDLANVVDAELVKITKPVSSPALSDSEEVRVRLTNNGGAPLSNFQLKLELGSQTVTETFSDIIEPLETVEYTFSEKLNLSAESEYTISTSIIPPDGDIDTCNDAKTVVVVNRNCPCISTFPWTEQFMNGVDCWLNYDANEDGYSWIYAAPVPVDEGGLGYGAMFSESFLSLPYGAYPTIPDNWLISSKIVLDNQPYTLQFDIAAQDAIFFEEYYSVLVSTTGTAASDFMEIHSATIEGGLGEVGFKTVALDLGAYSGQSIYIAFRHWNCKGQFILILANVSITNGSSIHHAKPLLSLQAHVANGTLHVSGLAAGERFTVYNASGQAVHTGAGSSSSTVRLKTRGVYVVRSEKHTVKVVY
jgi:hypothetical protein